MFRTLGIFCVALAIAVVVHGGSFGLCLAGADRALLTHVTDDPGVGDPIVRVVAAIEKNVVAFDAQRVAVLGLLLIAVFATTAACAFTSDDAPRGTHFVLAALIAASLSMTTTIMTIAGHAGLVAMILGAHPLARAFDDGSSRRRRLLFGLIGAAFFFGIPCFLSTRTLGATHAAIADRMWTTLRYVFAPVVVGDADRKMLAVCGALILAPLIAICVVDRRNPAGRRLLVRGIVLAIIGTIVSGLGKIPAADLLDPHVGTSAAAGLALIITGAFAGTPASSDRRSIAAALCLLVVGVDLIAARHVVADIRRATDDHEIKMIAADVARLPAEVVDVVVLGLPKEPVRLDAAAWISAESTRGRRIRGLTEGNEGTLTEPGRIANDRRTLLAEWRPRHLTALATRPENWVVAPWIGLEPGTIADRIRLTSPGDGAEGSTERPRTLADDQTFTFEIDRGTPIGEDDGFVFYSYWSGGFKPKGRQNLTARRLEPSVLAQSVTDDGSRRYTWRTAIRPGPGEEGVPFDEDELELAGKTMIWTIGLVRGIGEEDHDHPRLPTTAPSGGERPVSEKGPPKSAPADIRFPSTIARPRRLHFRAAHEN